MSTNPRQFALHSQSTELGNGNCTDNEIAHANGLVIRNIIIYHGTADIVQQQSKGAWQTTRHTQHTQHIS